MREPDPATEVRRLIAAESAELPDLIAAILAERAADAYFLHGIGTEAPPVAGVITVPGVMEARADETA